MSYCQIIKDKSSGEEYLIPYCGGVANHMYLDISDRKLIKEYCYCIREKRQKYQTKTRDEVFIAIDLLKESIAKIENDLLGLKHKLEVLETEVFMLDAVEVDVTIPEN